MATSLRDGRRAKAKLLPAFVSPGTPRLRPRGSEGREAMAWVPRDVPACTKLRVHVSPKTQSIRPLRPIEQETGRKKQQLLYGNNNPWTK